GPDLKAAGTRADEGEPGPGDVEILGPARRVERRTGKGVHTFDIGHPGQIQRPDRADDEPGLETVLLAVRPAQRQVPQSLLLVPSGFGHGGTEAAVGPQAVPVDDCVEVRPKFGLAAVVLAPVLSGIEREAVLVAPHVDARP